MGSTTTNEDGTFYSAIQYTAFGEIRLTRNTTLTDYRFTGQLAQAELGLDYYVARWYDPQIGHFTQADTIVPEPGQASNYDRYAYVLNNPVMYSDPTGHRDSGKCGPGEDCDNKRKSQKPSTKEDENPFSKPAHLMDMTENELAKFQGNQGTTNNCAPNAIATALNIFYKSNLNGNDLGNLLDSNYTPYYRVAPNQATLPFQQIHIVNDISNQGNLDISASFGSVEKAELVKNLRNHNIVQMVTFIWIFTEPPNLQRGSKDGNYLFNAPKVSGHTMILASFDLYHINEKNQSTPWGFVNSWGNDYDHERELPDQIFWMADDQLKNYSVVLITKKE